MKIRLAVSEEKKNELKDFFESHGIEIDENSNLILTETNDYMTTLLVKSLDRQNKIYINIDSIIYLESYGHDIYIHCIDGDFITNEPIRELEYLLNPLKFIRVSQSVIVAKLQIKEIRPSLYQKYTLIMSDKSIVDVTRSYYNNFRDDFRI